MDPLKASQFATGPFSPPGEESHSINALGVDFILDLEIVNHLT